MKLNEIEEGKEYADKWGTKYRVISKEMKWHESNGGKVADTKAHLKWIASLPTYRSGGRTKAGIKVLAFGRYGRSREPYETAIQPQKLVQPWADATKLIKEKRKAERAQGRKQQSVLNRLDDIGLADDAICVSNEVTMPIDSMMKLLDRLQRAEANADDKPMGGFHE